MAGDSKGAPGGVSADGHVRGSPSKRGSYAVRRRALVTLAVIAAGLLGILAPAVAFTRSRAPMPRANSAGHKRKQHPRPQKSVPLAVSVKGNRLVNARDKTVRLV